jgi:hypothetical protein
MNRLLAQAFVGCCVLMALMGLALPVGCELKRGGRACGAAWGEGGRIVAAAAGLLTAAISKFGE